MGWEHVVKGMNVVLISGCSQREESADAEIDGRPNGALTLLLAPDALCTQWPDANPSSGGGPNARRAAKKRLFAAPAVGRLGNSDEPAVSGCGEEGRGEGLRRFIAAR